MNNKHAANIAAKKAAFRLMVEEAESDFWLTRRNMILRNMYAFMTAHKDSCANTYGHMVSASFVLDVYGVDSGWSVEWMENFALEYDKILWNASLDALREVETKYKVHLTSVRDDIFEKLARRCGAYPNT